MRKQKVSSHSKMLSIVKPNIDLLIAFVRKRDPHGMYTKLFLKKNNSMNLAIKVKGRFLLSQ